MKRIKEMFCRKEQASSVLADMLPILMAIVLTGMLAVVYASWVSNFEEKETINAIVREYLLRMETVGCLNTTDAALLRNELAANQMEDISLEGTTFLPVENGERVVLKVRGKLRLKRIKMENWLKWNSNQTDTCDIQITRTATAIY